MSGHRNGVPAAGRAMPGMLVGIALGALLIVKSVLAHPLAPDHVDDFTGKPRIIVLTDIGNEPDDQMSLVRLLMYSNQLDLEALVATTSTWQREQLHPETMHELIAAYGAARPNLLQHAAGWPEAGALDARVSTGPGAYGMAGLNAGASSSGRIVRPSRGRTPKTWK